VRNVSKWVVSVVCVLTLVLAAGAQVWAQAEEEFVPVTGDDIVTEQLPATPLVFAAYAAVWIGLLVYVLGLWRKLVRVERDLAEVKSALESRSP